MGQRLDGMKRNARPTFAQSLTCRQNQWIQEIETHGEQKQKRSDST
jgi:hypothetical protein